MTPALDHRSAARILDLADPADASSGPRKARSLAGFAILLAISAIAAHATVAGGSPTAALGADSFSARVGRAHAAAIQESSHMHRLMAVAASGAVAMGSSAFAQDAVQWRVEDGGNGHWYALLPNVANRVWSSAQAEAAVLNAMLASISSAEEFTWIRDGLASSPNAWNQSWGPFLGGVQAEGAADATSGWSWLDGSSWWSAWGPNDCGADDTCVNQRWLSLGRCAATQEVSYNDDLLRGQVGQCGTVSPRSALIEWSADCNADGVVDYGQIRAGELDDANANNIPDCCEAGTACGCAADISGNGIVDAVDLAAVLSSWGNAPTGKTNADINRDGEINAIDLAEVLSSWGACP